MSLCGALTTFADAAEFAPRTFTPDSNARAVEVSERGDWNSRTSDADSSFEKSSSSGVLRWRVKQPTQSTTTTTTAKPVVAQSKAAATANRSYGARVRQAGAQDDAFANPFGDRYPVRQVQAQDAFEPEPPMGLNPAQPPAEEEAAPPPRFQPLRPRGEEDPLPKPPMFPRRPAPAAEEEMQPMPEPEEAPGPNAKYNLRNCEVDGKTCVENRLKLKSDLLINKNDLLDITPPLALSTDTQQQVERSMQNFKRNPAREWRDRTGQVVARGKLEKVAYRYATIHDENGEEIKIALNQLGDDEQCFLAGWWNVPAECRLGDEVHPGRNFIPSEMTWTASALCHKPLYFEEVQLERYGHTAGLFQPVLSGAHFFVNIAVLPYHMGINPPNECMYALGYYRPGSCAPWLVPPVPLSVRGLATQAGAAAIIVPIVP